LNMTIRQQNSDACLRQNEATLQRPHHRFVYATPAVDSKMKKM